MKTFRILTVGWLGFFLCLFPSALRAEPGNHAAGLMVGQVWPSGEIGQDVDGSVAPGIFYEYSASDVFSVYASAVRSTHSEGNLKLLSTNLGMKANLIYLDKLSPYVMVGAGLYFVDKLIVRTAERAEDTNFGFHLGLGADLDLSDLFFMGLQFDIHNLFSTTVNLPANGRTEISGRWAGFFLRGGVRF
jgi:opacity protein-like surface antigen